MNPEAPILIVELALPSTIWWAMLSARSIGIAKPVVVWLPTLPVDAAVSMPMTLPFTVDSGPPESPSTMSALVCSMSCSVSLPPRSSLAVMVWSRLVMSPATTAGLPPAPSALPIATTWVLTFTDAELPSGTVVSPDAPTSWMTETSSVLSYPSHFALYFLPFETSVAVSPVVSSMT